MKFVKLILVILCFPLLFAATFVNTESIFQFNLGDVYVYVCYFYLVASILLALGFKYLNIENTSLKFDFMNTIKFILYFCILLIPGVLAVHYLIPGMAGSTDISLRVYGKVAFLYLVLSLSVSPILAFVDMRKYGMILVLARKMLGILSFIFFLKHGIVYFSTEHIFHLKNALDSSFLGYVFDNLLHRFDALSGVVAGILMLVLGLTSNNLSIKLLSGKGWKKVQSLVFPAFIISSIHVALSSRFNLFYVVLIIWLVTIRTAAYIKRQPKELSPVNQ